MRDVAAAIESDLASLKHRSLNGAVATAGAQLIGFGLQFLAQIWLARLIAPSQYGLIAMVAPILGFISVISDMGLGTALIQQRSISQSQVSGLFWLNAVVTALISLLLVAIAPLLGTMYREPKTVSITIMLAALLFIGSLGIYPSALLAREMRFVVRSSIDITQSTIGLIVGISAARAGYGYWALLDQQAGATISGLLITWFAARWWPSRPRWDPSSLRLLRFGTSLTLSNVATYLSTTADNILVGVVDGKIALGLYDKSYGLVLAPLGLICAPIGRIAIPLLSRLQDYPERYESTFRKMIQLPLFCCVPGLICGMFLAPQLVDVFLGPKWYAVSPVFAWICVGGLASYLYGSAFWLLSSQGRGRDQATWSLITAAINVLSFAIGIRWGAVGVASVSAVTFVLLQTPMMLWAACRKGPVSVRHILSAIGPIAFAFSITSSSVYFFSRSVHWGSLAELAGGAGLCLSIYLVSVCFWPSGRELVSTGFGIANSYLIRLTTVK